MVTVSWKEVYCPECGKRMFMGSMKKEHKKYKDVIQIVKNGINYICLNCIKGDDALPGFRKKNPNEENLK